RGIEQCSWSHYCVQYQFPGRFSCLWNYTTRSAASCACRMLLCRPPSPSCLSRDGPRNSLSLGTRCSIVGPLYPVSQCPLQQLATSALGEDNGQQRVESASSRNFRSRPGQEPPLIDTW